MPLELEADATGAGSVGYGLSVGADWSGGKDTLR
jgi:hypothetical protein